ncbi:hypothetical protein [Methylocaldum sp.]|uniref:hypothetical protein n=1 Tax=Methylocaldum sp. TaxID=1969727 RepID=UPI00321FF3A8
MALTISIRFLTGRAHLHHWQAHHSDGKVDWPPSPWRLLRALVAVAGRGLTTLPPPDFVSGAGKKPKPPKKNPAPIGPPADYVALPDNWYGDGPVDEIPLSRLAALLACLAPAPEIWLPRTSGGHTRQFFPIHKSGMVKNSGSAVFDTFAVVDKQQPIFFCWPDITPDPEDQRIRDLKRILQRMTYFGRAESWCEAQLHTVLLDAPEGVVLGKTHWRCVCIEDGGKPDGQEHRDYTLERKLTSLPLIDNREYGLATEARQLLPRTNKLNPSRSKEPSDFGALLEKEPDDKLLLRCLLRESGQDMKDGLERPIGSRWVHYAVPRAVYNLPRPTPHKRAPRIETVHVVRYALNTTSVQRPVLPPLTDTLLVADKFRSAVLALHREKSRNLSGHDENGKPCVDHDHAYWWPTDEDNDGLIDHVTVYCHAGFGPSEIAALRRLVRIRQRGGRPDLLITPIYVGTEEEFSPWRLKNGAGEDCTTSVFISATPYFCPVHLTHGRGRSGRTRPITPEILKGLKIQGVITEDDEVRSIQEVVYDYAPDELAEAQAAIAMKQIAEPLPPRQFFPIIAPPPDYPPLPDGTSFGGQRFAGASLKNPDSGFPFGLSVGVLVDNLRFIRAMSFCRRRRNCEVKGYGRMFRIEFSGLRKPRPFAIGDQCHFGLGLFVPA